MNRSVIIPTAKTLRSVAPTLVSLAELRDPPEEVLVVQNGLSEHERQQDQANYPSVVERFAKIGLKVFYDDVPGLLSGRHRGLQEATGDLLVFVDDDVTFSPHWLTELTSALDDSNTVLAGGPSLPVFAGQPPEWLNQFWCSTSCGGRQMAQLSLLELNVDKTIAIDPELVWGLNYAIRANTLRMRGGFRPDCLPARLQHFQGDGETGLSRAVGNAGERAVYNPQAIVYHHIGSERMTYEYFDQRSFYQGVCDSYSMIRERGVRHEDDTPAIAKVLELARTLKRKLSPGKGTDLLAARFERAYQRGFQFHRQCVKSSPRLLQWVRRENYFDYDYPQLEPQFIPVRRRVHD